MIYYRQVHVQETAPSSPPLGEIWIKPLGGTYQCYIWLNKWASFAGGGIFISESNADTFYINVIIQEEKPDGIIKPGWIWIKESIETAYWYIFDYVIMVGT